MANYHGLTSDIVLDTKKNSELNVLLGENPGEPKYSQNQMKSITKAMLIAELTELIAAMEAVKPAPVAKGKRGASTKVSKNKAVAASKQTNIIKAVADKKMSVEDAHARYAADIVLQQYCPADKWGTLMASAIDGKRPGAVRQLTTLTIEIDD